MRDILKFPAELEQAFDLHGQFTDFHELVTGDAWTTVIEAGSAINLLNEKGGVVSLVTDGTDNEDIYIKSTAEQFDLGAKKEIFAICRLQFADPATNVANVAFGVADACVADRLADDGAGLGTIVGSTIYTVDGANVWNCSTTLSSVTKTHTTELAAAGTSYQTLALKISPNYERTEVSYLIDPLGGRNLNQCKDNTELRNLIKHSFTTPSSTTACVWVGCKAGSAAALTVKVDYLGCWQAR